MASVRFACPLDCYDACGLVAEVEDGRVVRIRGDHDHPFTRGKVCIKGKGLLRRQYHPQRLLQPLKRVGGELRPATWDEALDTLAARLIAIKQGPGTQAVLHYADGGYEGVSKKVDEVFFNCYGGVTEPTGSLCWGAGIAAQNYDLGMARSHAPQDIAKARLILIWGRNPAATGPHLVPFIQQAKKAGARIILIDPLSTATAGLADTHLAVRPGTDGALALGVAHLLVGWGRIDETWLADNALGWRRFTATLKSCTPQWSAGQTGLSVAAIEALAEAYGSAKPAAILLGIGLQRYENGGSTVRCIDALAALTGNIGRSGGGVSYANRHTSPWISKAIKASAARGVNRRSFPLPRLADALANTRDPAIEMAVITKANPLVQAPDTQALNRAFEAIPFTVVFDQFLTDTARRADWVLPATTILEEEDLVFSGMFSPYLVYSPKVVAPPEGVMSEYEVFRQLARRLDLNGYPDVDKKTFLERCLAPLTDQYGLTLADLDAKPFCLPETEVPWRSGGFDTPSGKYELFSRRAVDAGLDALPTYCPPVRPDEDYPLRFITPHRHDSLHSQGFAFEENTTEAFVHPDELEQAGIAAGRRVRLVSGVGSLEVRIGADRRVRRGVVMIYEGWWQKSGAVNRLVAQGVSDMGSQATYYDTFCRMDRI